MKNDRIITIVCIIIVLILVAYLVNYKTNPLEQEKKEKIIELLKNREDVLVIMIAGQSNAANHSEYIIKSTNRNIYVYNEGAIYLAKHPLIGSSGTKGGPWICFSKEIIKETNYKRIVLVPIAQGGTTIMDWSVGKDYELLERTFFSLKNDGLDVDIIIFQQGEEDNHNQTSYLKYKSSLTLLTRKIQRIGFQGKMFISVTSYSPSSKTKYNNNIRQAQIEVIEEIPWVYLGPDTDSITDHEDRYDGIHFSKKGIKTLSKSWADFVLNEICK